MIRTLTLASTLALGLASAASAQVAVTLGDPYAGGRTFAIGGQPGAYYAPASGYTYNPYTGQYTTTTYSTRPFAGQTTTTYSSYYAQPGTVYAQPGTYYTQPGTYYTQPGTVYAPAYGAYPYRAGTTTVWPGTAAPGSVYYPAGRSTRIGPVQIWSR